jgi:hypothetical protein
VPKAKRVKKALPIQRLTIMCKEECVSGQRRQRKDLNQKPENGSGEEECVRDQRRQREDLNQKPENGSGQEEEKGAKAKRVGLI